MPAAKKAAPKEVGHDRRAKGWMAAILLFLSLVLYRHDWGFPAGILFALGTAAIGAACN